MRKLLLAFSVMMMCHIGTYSADVSDSNKGTAVVTGHGKALPEEVTVRLFKFNDGVGNLVATDTIKNSQFRFETPVEDGLTIYSLMFNYKAFPPMMHNPYLSQIATSSLLYGSSKNSHRSI